MRVLLVNKFYYQRGGDCVVMLNTETMLRESGHEVAVFAMQYSENLTSPYSGYFAPEVVFSGGFGRKAAAFRRIMGWDEVKSLFKRLLDDFKPEVVHLHNIHSYLSPIVAQMAHERGVRVVWTLHDYKLICPAYNCLRDGKPCELCFHHKSRVMFKRCMKQSLAASVVAWIEALKWSRRRLEQFTDVFVCPSKFMASKMAQAGFNKDKLKVLSNCVENAKLETIAASKAAERKQYYCYVGRLSPEKGVQSLLEAAAQRPYELLVAGDGPLTDELRQKYACCSNIRFLGKLNSIEVAQLLSKAKLSVVPSIWYENNPLSVIESLCAGTPVIGAEIGGIPELIAPTTGLTYAAGNVEALVQAIDMAMLHRWDHDRIAHESTSRFAPESYLRQLTDIYTAQE